MVEKRRNVIAAIAYAFLFVAPSSKRVLMGGDFYHVAVYGGVQRKRIIKIFAIIHRWLYWICFECLFFIGRGYHPVDYKHWLHI